ncbi:hypothetical protein KY308_00390, partial [Candidatus Woesearchaeota archaeon]|nr:hypothetical protein [Candidatus Woesearchaeota archaeon]
LGVTNEDSHYLKVNLLVNGNTLQSETTKITDNRISGSVPAETLLIANLLDGVTYNIVLEATDYAGNTNAMVSDNITIDDTPPVFSSEDVNISAEPIYSYFVTGEGGRVYYVREDLIEVFGNVPNDTTELRFYRLTGTTPPLIARIIDCAHATTKASCIDENGTFYVKSSSLIIGESGKVTPNIIQLIAKDRADNIFEISKFIYKDWQKPTVIVCTQTECTEEIVEVSAPITDPQQMIATCGGKVDCYDVLITGACENPTTKTVDFGCYADYVSKKIKLDFLYPLCDRAVLYRDSCLRDLAVNTGAIGLCDKISNVDTKEFCRNSVTGT